MLSILPLSGVALAAALPSGLPQFTDFSGILSLGVFAACAWFSTAELVRSVKDIRRRNTRAALRPALPDRRSRPQIGATRGDDSGCAAEHGARQSRRAA